jgi:hypothetical protein
MAPPVSWHLTIDEVRRYVVTVLGVPDDSALDTVLQVQHALLPAADRVMPLALQLSHDFETWHAGMLRAKEEGHLEDWHERIPRLVDLPPADFVVEDPNHVCTAGLGFDIEFEPYGNWEMVSPVGRAIPARHLLNT